MHETDKRFNCVICTYQMLFSCVYFSDLPFSVEGDLSSISANTVVSSANNLLISQLASSQVMGKDLSFFIFHTFVVVFKCCCCYCCCCF